MRRGLLGLALEHLPQLVDVRGDIDAGARAIPRRALAGGVEARHHERAQVESWVVVRAHVFLEDCLGGRAWQGIDEGLAVLVHALELHPLEETGIQLRRGSRRSVVTAGRRCRMQQEKQGGGDDCSARPPPGDEWHRHAFPPFGSHAPVGRPTSAGARRGVVGARRRGSMPRSHSPR